MLVDLGSYVEALASAGIDAEQESGQIELGVIIDDAYCIVVLQPPEFGNRWLVFLGTSQLTQLGSIGTLLDALVEQVDAMQAAEVYSPTHDTAHLSMELAVEDVNAESVGPLVEDLFDFLGEILHEAGDFGVRFATIDEDEIATTPGFREAGEARRSLEADDPAAALGWAEAALPLLGDAGLLDHQMVALGNAAEAHRRLGGPDRAIELLQQVSQVFDELAVERGRRAEAHNILGASLADAGRTIDAIAELRIAVRLASDGGHPSHTVWAAELRAIEALYTSSGANAIDELRRVIDAFPADGDQGDLARHEHNLGSLMRSSGSSAQAVPILRRAMDRLEAIDSRRIAASALELSGALAEAGEHAEARIMLNRHRRDPALRGALAQASISAIDQMLGLSDPAPTQHDPVDRPTSFVSALEIMNNGYHAYQGGDFDSALHLGSLSRDWFAANGSRTEAAKAALNVALARVARAVTTPGGDVHESAQLALDDCLKALEFADDARHTFATVPDRASWQRMFWPIYDVALGLAIELGDAGLALEIMERSHAQGVPDSSTARPPDLALFSEGDGAYADGPVALTSVGAVPLEPPPHLVVGAESRLAPDGATTIDLESILHDRVGADGWWWTMQLGVAHLYSIVRSPDGSLFCRSTEVRAVPTEFTLAGDFEDSGTPNDVGLWLEELRRNVLVGDVGGLNRKTILRRSLAGVYGERSQREAELAADLGRALIPRQLREALGQASRDEPIQLMITPTSSLAWLPYGLLGVGPEDDPSSVRVLERAVVRSGGPLSIPAVEPSPDNATGQLGVVDPTGELPSMRSLAHFDSSDGGTNWSPQSLLHHLGRSERATAFLFVGHALARSNPFESGLLLERGSPSEVLTVADLLRQATDLQPPRRAVLCACSTAADGDPIGNERWGVPIALLLAGCESVVASTWDVLANETTAAIVGELTERTITNDPGMALRSLQLERLDAWRTDIAASRVSATHSSNQPYFWAPWVVMSAGFTEGNDRKPAVRALPPPGTEAGSNEDRY